MNSDRHTPKIFFIDGIGGSRNSYLYETLPRSIHSQGYMSIAIAVSGIAATFMTSRQTVHSAFTIPLNIIETTTCNITVQSPEAHWIREATVIVMNEAT